MTLFVVILLHMLLFVSCSDMSNYECFINNNIKSASVQKICEEENRLTKRYKPSNDSIYHIHKHNQIQMEDSFYFKSSLYNSKRDIRFAYQELATTTNIERKSYMSNLLKQWKEFTDDRQLVYWLTHSTLLGWYWQQDILPWDYNTAAVQILADDLDHRYIHFNDTLFKERYLFDINPHHLFRQHQVNNIVDARFIDTTNGYFIEVTALTYNDKHDALHCKVPHYYKPDLIFPLRAAFLGGLDTWVPSRVVEVLTKEYDSTALTSTTHRDRPIVNLRVGKGAKDHPVGGHLYRYDKKAKMWKLEW